MKHIYFQPFVGGPHNPVYSHVGGFVKFRKKITSQCSFFSLTKSFPDRRPFYKTWDFFGSPLNGNIFIRESDMLGNLNIFSDLGETPKNIDLRHVESELAKCSEKYEAHQTFLQKWLICVEENQSRMIWI